MSNSDSKPTAGEPKSERIITTQEEKILKAYHDLLSNGGPAPHVEFRDSLFRILYAIALYADISSNHQLQSDADILMQLHIFFEETERGKAKKIVERTNGC